MQTEDRPTPRKPLMVTITEGNRGILHRGGVYGYVLLTVRSQPEPDGGLPDPCDIEIHTLSSGQMDVAAGALLLNWLAQNGALKEAIETALGLSVHDGPTGVAKEWFRVMSGLRHLAQRIEADAAAHRMVQEAIQQAEAKEAH